MARSAAKPTTSRKAQKLPLEDGRRGAILRAVALDASAGPRLAWWLGSAYAMLVLIGFIAFRLPGATVRGNEMSVERSVFTVINAATLTGFQQAVPIDDYGWLGRVTVFALTVGGTILTLIIGGLALVRLLRLPIPDSRVINGTLTAYVICTIAGTMLLLERGQPIGASFFNAASAFGNSGLYVGTLPGAADWRMHVVLLPLAVLGGVGMPVLIDLYDAAFGRRALSTHSRVVLAMTAAAYVAGFVLLTRWSSVRAGNVGDMLASGSAMALDARTPGFPISPISMMPRATQWMLMLFMLIGASPAGAAGGLKLTTLLHLWNGTRRALRGEVAPRIAGIAFVWTGIYIGIVTLTVLFMLAAQRELPADRLLFLSVSAVGTVGLSHDPVSMAGPGLTILSVAMLLGRVMPLMVLWWAAETTDDVEIGI